MLMNKCKPLQDLIHNIPNCRLREQFVSVEYKGRNKY